jgi:hypothetical protein
MRGLKAPRCEEGVTRTPVYLPFCLSTSSLCLFVPRVGVSKTPFPTLALYIPSGGES